MSISVIEKVRKLEIGMVDKALLEAVADQVNDSGHGQVSFSEITRRIGLTERGSRNVIKRLLNAGHMKLIGKQGPVVQVSITLETGDTHVA